MNIKNTAILKKPTISLECAAKCGFPLTMPIKVYKSQKANRGKKDFFHAPCGRKQSRLAWTKSKRSIYDI